MKLGVNTFGLGPDDIAAIQRLGVTYVRRDLEWWKYSENHEGHYRDYFHGGMDAAIAAGLKVLVMVHEPKSYRYSSAGFLNFLREMAERHPQVWAWQIGNEKYFDGSSPRFFGELTAQAGNEIRHVSPEALIVTRAFNAEELVGVAFKSFWIQCWSAVNALSVHIYNYPLGVRVGQTLAALNSVPIRNQKIFVTETGMDLHSIPVEDRRDDWEHAQAVQAAQCIDSLEISGRIAMAMWYTLQTGQPGVVDPQGRPETHGLYDVSNGDWRLRPVGAYWSDAARLGT